MNHMYINCFRDEFPKLEYLTLCIKESMRMHPPVASIMRKPTVDIEVDGRVIKAGKALQDIEAMLNILLSHNIFFVFQVQMSMYQFLDCITIHSFGKIQTLSILLGSPKKIAKIDILMLIFPSRQALGKIITLKKKLKKYLFRQITIL